MSWSFGHLSDSHVRPDTPMRSQVFVDHLAEIAAGDCAFVIHTGDLQDEPSAWHARAFRALASLLPIPLYCVPGNHDIYNPPMHELEAPWWARLEVDEEKLAEYHRQFGASWYTFSHEGTGLVAINSLILNSELPQEREQWAWLADTLAQLVAQRVGQIVLFTHLPLFIHRPGEELDPEDFRNRYLVVAPPARDRLLEMVRTYHIGTVLTGHAHVPWEVSHTWPDGFTTRFITTGSSGLISAMAANHFRLPVSPAEGLGYHEHRIGGGELRSHYRHYEPGIMSGRWALGSRWTVFLPASQVPEPQNGQSWSVRDYEPLEEAWRLSEPSAEHQVTCPDGNVCYIRQTADLDDDAAAVYLELDTEQATDVYVNGELLYEVDAVRDRPPAWRSAGGTHTLDSARLCLGLNPGLGRKRPKPLRKGRNTIALRIDGGEPPGTGESRFGPTTRVAYRTLELDSELERAEGEG